MNFEPFVQTESEVGSLPISDRDDTLYAQSQSDYEILEYFSEESIQYEAEPDLEKDSSILSEFDEFSSWDMVDSNKESEDMYEMSGDRNDRQYLDSLRSYYEGSGLFG